MTNIEWLDTKLQQIGSVDYLLAGTALASSPGPDSSNERFLIARIMAGDKEAFAGLVRPYLYLFTAGIHRILQDVNDTQEALQAALLRIHAEMPCFGEHRKFQTWAYRTCLDEALTWRRSRVRQKEKDTGNLLQYLSGDGQQVAKADSRLYPQGIAASGKCITELTKTKIQEELDRLPDDQRVVLIMRDLEGMETEDVARKLGLTRRLVRQHLHQARMGLCNALVNLVGDQVAI